MLHKIYHSIIAILNLGLPGKNSLAFFSSFIITVVAIGYVVGFTEIVTLPAVMQPVIDPIGPLSADLLHHGILYTDVSGMLSKILDEQEAAECINPEVSRLALDALDKATIAFREIITLEAHGSIEILEAKLPIAIEALKSLQGSEFLREQVDARVLALGLEELEEQEVLFMNTDQCDYADLSAYSDHSSDGTPNEAERYRSPEAE